MPNCERCGKEANPPLCLPCSHVLCCCCTSGQKCPSCGKEYDPTTLLLTLPSFSYQWVYSSAKKPTWWAYDGGANCNIEMAWKDYQKKNSKKTEEESDEEPEESENPDTSFEPVDYSSFDRIEAVTSSYLLSIGARKYRLDFSTMTQAPTDSPKKSRKIDRFTFPSTGDPLEHLKKLKVLGIAGLSFS